MKQQVLAGLIAILGMFVLWGCAQGTVKLSTDQEKKAFAGGPMPPEARKLFEQSQQKSAQMRAERIAKIRASELAGKP